MIIHIVGKPRSGKGILATFLALQEADRGRIVQCNYHLDSPNAKFITFIDLLQFLKLPRQEPTQLLVIDELPGWCDSYTSTTKSSRFASHFLNQSQKLGYDLIFTSQRSMRADINFRELSDLRFRAEKDTEKKCFTYYILDTEFTDEDVETGKKFQIPFEYAEQFWKRYDTYEAVPPVGLDEVLEEVRTQTPELINKKINLQIKRLRENYPNCLPYNRVQCEDLLYELGESTKFAGVVCARLQRTRNTYLTQAEKRTVPNTATAAPRTNWQEKWLKARPPTVATAN